MTFLLLGCTDSNVPKVLSAQTADENIHTIQIQCSEVWYQQVETRLTSGDGQGHGPDLGSEEWQSVIEFKLGIRGDSSVPQRNTDQWCTFIDGLLQH
ncbi:hypothetical protein [Shewanella sp. OMA3-2]|uniref:hypothetical protein n=1 Tax=Shewanella sp. OMA3-2 TaxID=2908650 RepID=UPI001F387C8F|nr:hypothetical protein [Shewanella sp. OMA3-2]UJF23239.1 hypothetical protein L0B17_07935 [Shewanella sp. OMA3-2]